MVLLHEEITDKIIGCFYDVYNELGFGFLERVDQNALNLVLQERGLRTQVQMRIPVIFHGAQVGEYYADVVVESCVILEIKAIEMLADAHERQLLNYLKATDFEVGLLLNFGKEPEIVRRALTNDRKSGRPVHARSTSGLSHAALDR